MAVMWAALPRSGPCARLGDHKMGGSDAPHLHLRSDAASSAMHLAPWPLLGHVTQRKPLEILESRRPPTNPRHDAKKARMKETRLGEKCLGDNHAEGGGVCPRPTEKNTTPARRRAPAALGGCHDPATPNAQAATPPSHRTSLALWRWILVRDVPFGGAAWFFFVCGVEQTPVFVWRVVVVGGLCARRRKCEFVVVTGRVAVNSRRSDVTSNPL